MAEIRRFYVEEGSAVREIAEPLPSRQEREEAERRKNREVYRAREIRKAQVMRENRLHTLYLCVGVMVFALFFAYYVHLQAETSQHMRSVAALRQEVSDMRAENVEESNRINAQTNLTQVRDLASTYLGMSYATNDRIVYYNVDDGDYMSQYEDIP